MELLAPPPANAGAGRVVLPLAEVVGLPEADEQGPEDGLAAGVLGVPKPPLLPPNAVAI